MASFSVKTWAEEFEITPDTLQILEDKGFNSKKSISKLSTDMIKKDFAKALKPAQVLLLQEAVESLHDIRPLNQTTDDTSSTTETASTSRVTNNSQASALPSDRLQQQLDKGTTLSVQDIMGLLGTSTQSTDHSAEPTANTQGKTLVFDPLAFDPLLDTKTTKMRDIRDFITVRAKSKGDSSEGTICMQGSELVIKESKGPLDNVTIAQYMEGSLRILRACAIEDKVDINGIMQQVGYLIKFAQFAQTFRWKSLLNYDYEYRRAQSEAGFPWGSDSPYLMQLHLVPTSVNVEQPSHNKRQGLPGSRPQGVQKNRYDPKSGNVICHKYNGKQGCNLRGCKFAHVCLTCFGNHPGCQHSDSSKANPKPE